MNNRLSSIASKRPIIGIGGLEPGVSISRVADIHKNLNFFATNIAKTPYQRKAKLRERVKKYLKQEDAVVTNTRIVDGHGVKDDVEDDKFGN